MAESWGVDENDRNESRVAVKDENGLLICEAMDQDAPLLAAAPQLCGALAEVLGLAEDADYGSHEVEITLTKDQLEYFRGLIAEAMAGYPDEDDDEVAEQA